MISHRLIFSFYACGELTIYHYLHLILLSKFIHIFNDIDLILLIDDNTDIDSLKNLIIEYLQRNDINFIIRQNNSFYREGIVYKEFIIDKLNEFKDNELVFFAHTKGVTNELNINNVKLTVTWITLMYFLNLYYGDFDVELISNNNVCYGTLYNYDDSNLTKYHWQYTGSFQWINPKRLYEKIENKDLIYRDYDIKIIAEQFLGNNVSTEYVAFKDHNLFNKKYSLLLYESHDFTYHNIWYLAYSFITIDTFYDLINFANDLNNLVSEQLNINILNCIKNE